VDVLTPYTPDAGRNLAVHDEESVEIPGSVAAIKLVDALTGI
jgi:hypothetical protein